MKTITLITAIILIMSSCTQKNEISQCPSQLVSSNEPDCYCKYLRKKINGKRTIKSKNGLIMFQPKIKSY